MNRALIYQAATARFIAQREDVLLLGPPGTGKATWPKRSAARPFSRAMVWSTVAHTLLGELAETTLAGTRKDYLTELAAVPLLIIDELGMRKLPHTAAEDLLELIIRRYERASTLLRRIAPSTTGASSSATRRQ